MNWKKWKDVDRDLKKGEIIRLRLKKKDQRGKDGYIYGRVSSGFGHTKSTIGTKIYVHNEAWDYESCKSKKSKDECYWRRDLGRIEVQP